MDALLELGLVAGATDGPSAGAPLGIPAPALLAPSVPPYADGPRRTSRVLVAVLATGALTIGGALGATIHGPSESLAAAAAPSIVIAAPAPSATAGAGAGAASAAADGAGGDTAGVDDGASADTSDGGGSDGGDLGDLGDATADAGAVSGTSDAGSGDASGSDDGSSAAPTPSSGDDTPGSPTAAPTPTPAPTATTAALPAIGHVWVISLTGQDVQTAFTDPVAAPYLAGQLVGQGTLLTGYRAVGAGQLANGVAMISGQAPNAATEAGCPVPSDVTPGTLSSPTGLVSGDGCFYASDVRTLPAELTAAAKTWRAYLGGLPNPCAPSPTATATIPGYVPARNAFAAFHGLADPGGAACVPGEFDLSALSADLDDPPNVSWIVPSACDSGAAEPCSDGAPAGVPALDAFLSRVIPQIQASAAYKQDGLIVVTFDVGPSPADGQEPGPVGALLLGPKVRVGAQVATAADHYTLLRTLQNLFSLAPTGHAADPGRTPFGSDVWLPATPISTTTPNKTTTRSRHGGRIAALTPVP